MQQFISLHAARFLPERAAPHSAVNTQHYQLKAFSNPIAVKCYDVVVVVGVEWIDNVVFITSVQQSDSVVHTDSFSFVSFSTMV